MLCSNIDVKRDNKSVQITSELLMDIRASMTSRQQKCMDSKEKRVASLFFLEIGASSKQFSSFRRQMDLVSMRSRSWGEQHLAQGLGTGQCRRSAMNGRRALTLTYEEDFYSWLRRRWKYTLLVW